jgi:hypothetical protein
MRIGRNRKWGLNGEHLGSLVNADVHVNHEAGGCTGVNVRSPCTKSKYDNIYNENSDVSVFCHRGNEGHGGKLHTP